MTLPVRRALLSVSDKSGVLELARALAERGIELLSTGGTAQLLLAHAIPVREVAAYTGFPEIMDGRVKTLHPKIHGGLLGRRGVDEAVMAQHGLLPIDRLLVNLYPYATADARPGCSYAEAVENIDIGGPAMLRAAAKNHAAVLVVVDPGDYVQLLEELAQHEGGSSAAARARFAAKAFAHTARYDTMVAAWLAAQHRPADGLFPDPLALTYDKVQDLRYGENPHQAAAFYREVGAGGGSVASARVLQGKDLSFNNIADADTAIECVRQFEEPACVIVKHANPCGAALGTDALAAYEAAYRTDPTSAFGGIIAFNRELDAATAATITERQFIEVLAAPALQPEAVQVLAGKPNVRVLLTGTLAPAAGGPLEFRSVTGGLLAQSPDRGDAPQDAWSVATRRQPTTQELADLRFAWRVCRFVKSNAIVFARSGATVGVVA